ncbi:MAG: nucleotidyl transferase AbiEii/AbiGii toxin family protein [Candidatus Eisenbacteria bacterium]|nr:nucleotidyl transferase AbiEii/AbiGii toxin family protein [Candidatus Eisenbacteria bacterium]
MVIGGQAVLLYGEPRLTKDIDITLGMGTEGLKKLRGVTRKLGLRTLVDNPAEFVSKTMVLPVMYDKTGIRVNFIFSFSLYEKQAIERAVDVTFGRSVVKFAALEDVVIHKIIAGRARDLEDVKCILLKNRRYDKGYIRKWLGEFDESLKEDFSRTFRKILRQTQ